MKNRFAAIKHGYVKEDETIIDDKIMQHGKLSKCRDFINGRWDDYYIEQQEWDGLYWVSVENTLINN